MSQVYMIGNAHIDPVWLWNWQEGFAEIRATFASALDRLREFDAFVFTSSSAAYYEWIETIDPAMFREIQERVRQGRWVICGGWWVQPDCNLPAGEALIRQGLVGQRYLTQKFGAPSRTAYNVDSFGHSGALPQIFSKSGMKRYVFQRPSETENPGIPQHFLWQGTDGSRIQAYRLAYGYNNSFPHGNLEDKITDAQNQAHLTAQPVMCFFGVGNHGGGPTVKNLETILRHDQTVPVSIASPDAFFDGAPVPTEVYTGSLVHHAIGCYSAHIAIKQLHQSAVQKALTAEKCMAAAWLLGCTDQPQALPERVWKKILFNEFHDILAGCAIESAYISASHQLGEAISICDDWINLSLQQIASRIDTLHGKRPPRGKYGDWRFWEYEELGSPVLVFNPNAFPVRAPVQINRQAQKMLDDRRMEIPIQWVRHEQCNGKDQYDTLFIADVPAMGYAVYASFPVEEPVAVPAPAQDCPLMLENTAVRAAVSRRSGGLSGLWLAGSEQNLLTGDTYFAVIEDSQNDTWAHGKRRLGQQVGAFTCTHTAVVEDGAVRKRIRSWLTYGKSEILVDFLLYSEKSWIDVELQVNWQEKLKSLRWMLPSSLVDAAYSHGLAFGSESKPADATEQPISRWCGMRGCRGSLYLISGDVFSGMADGAALGLTLLRSAYFADHYGEKDDACRCMAQGWTSFSVRVFPGGPEDGVPLAERLAEECLQPCMVLHEGFHDGSLPPRSGCLSVEPDHVSISAVKKEENGQGLIIRCVETAGRRAEACLRLKGLPHSWSVPLRPYEIKTLRLDKACGSGSLTPCGILEQETEE